MDIQLIIILTGLLATAMAFFAFCISVPKSYSNKSNNQTNESTQQSTQLIPTMLAGCCITCCFITLSCIFMAILLIAL